MKYKTLQWNINGGKIRKSDADPLAEESYSIDGLDYIASVIQMFDPDIVTLQETHANTSLVQAAELAKRLHMPYFFNDAYDISHLDSGQNLGQAVLSRFPLVDHTFKLFFNPKYTLVRPNGEVWVSHNKGVTSCVAQIEDKNVVVETLHLIPFRKFGYDVQGEEAKIVINDVLEKVKNEAPYFLLQGDFNLNDQGVQGFLPGMFTEDMHEILLTDPTTVRGKKYDHILYRGLRLIEYKIFSEARTDHFPIYAEFDL